MKCKQTIVYYADLNIGKWTKMDQKDIVAVVAAFQLRLPIFFCPLENCALCDLHLSKYWFYELKIHVK